METAALERVKAIHGAVDEASKTLLMDAPYDSKQAALLKLAGFTGSENVRDFNDHRLNHDMAKHYSIKYPLFKFITEHQLEKIRAKYKLMTGSLSSFKGNIPAKNIDELSAFAIERGDLDLTIAQGNVISAGGIGGSAWPDLYMVPDFNRRLERMTRELMMVPVTIPAPDVNVYTGRSSGRGQYGAPEWQKDFEVKAAKVEQQKKQAPIAKLTFSDIVTEFPGKAMITADRELFNIPDRDLDPIVTVAVKGGYLVVTAWGAEAADPDVVNPIMN